MEEQPRIVVLDDWTDFWAGQPAVERLRERGEVIIHTTPAADEYEVMQRLAKRHRGPGQPRADTAQRARPAHQRNAWSCSANRAASARMSTPTAATERGIALVAAGGRGGSHVAIAELGLALLLALARQIPTNDRRVREGDWAAPPTRMLSGQTLGIMGLGNIGGAMAKLGQALQMKVIAWGPTLTPSARRPAASSTSPTTTCSAGPTRCSCPRGCPR